MRRREEFQFTVSVAVAECVSEPEVPLTVIVKVPLGVPPRGNPLQLLRASATSTARLHANFLPARRDANSHTARRASTAAIGPRTPVGRLGRKGENGIGGAIVRIVVLIVPFEVTAVVPDGVTLVGESVQMESGGAPEQASEVAAEKPFRAETETVKAALEPAATLRAAGAMEMEKSGVVEMPVPESWTSCGLLASLSVIVSVADAEPVAEGLKTTLIVQLAAIARESPQVLVCEKSAAFAPVMAMPVIVRADFELFVRVTLCDALDVLMFWLPKLRETGMAKTKGAADGDILATKAFAVLKVGWKEPGVVGKLAEAAVPTM